MTQVWENFWSIESDSGNRPRVISWNRDSIFFEVGGINVTVEALGRVEPKPKSLPDPLDWSVRKVPESKP